MIIVVLLQDLAGVNYFKVLKNKQQLKNFFCLLLLFLVLMFLFYYLITMWKQYTKTKGIRSFNIQCTSGIQTTSQYLVRKLKLSYIYTHIYIYKILYSHLIPIHCTHDKMRIWLQEFRKRKFVLFSTI